MQQFALTPGDIPFNGPTSVLVHRLKKLGWTLTATGVFEDRFGQVDVLSLHWDALVSRLKWSWTNVMTAAVAHRSSFGGLQGTDIDETIAGIMAYGEADQVFLRCGLDGTLYHEVLKDKQSRGKGTKCAYCGRPDSFRHRLWECTVFESARAGFQWFNYLDHLPPSMVCHGWAKTPELWPELVKYFDTIAPPEYSVVESGQTDVYHLFTDGACSFPEEPKLRYASFAVTIAGTELNSLEHRVLQAGHIAGPHQTAFRGELTAMMVAVRFVSAVPQKVCIWSDNKAVVRRLRGLLNGAVIPPNVSHSDLWADIQSQLTPSVLARIVVCKVVSHGAHRKALSDVEEWAFWHNALVDRAAGSFNEKRPQIFWTLWKSLQQELLQLRQLHRDILQVILQVGRMGSLLDRQEKQKPYNHGGEENSGGLGGSPDGEAPSQVPLQWVWSQKLVRHCHSCNLSRLQTWWLSRGVPNLAHVSGLEWISGLQLYVDYLLDWKKHGPVMVKGKWVPCGNQILCPHVVSTTRRIKMFLTMWKALILDNGLQIACRLKRPSSAAIAFWCQTYRMAWDPQRLARVDAILMQVLRKQITKPQELDEVDLLEYIPKGNGCWFMSGKVPCSHRTHGAVR